MTDREAMLAAIRASMADDLPRLAFADWLDEHGDPARAEYIRVQVALAGLAGHHHGPDRPTDWRCPVCERRTALRHREGALELMHGREWHPTYEDRRDSGQGWTAVVARWVPVGVGFRRGFVARVACAAGRWLEYGDALAAAHPVESVALATAPDWMHRDGRVWLHDGAFERGSRRLCRNVGVDGRVGDIATRTTYIAGLLAAEWPGVAFELPRAGGWGLLTGELLGDIGPVARVGPHFRAE